MLGYNLRGLEVRRGLEDALRDPRHQGEGTGERKGEGTGERTGEGTSEGKGEETGEGAGGARPDAVLMDRAEAIPEAEPAPAE